MGISRPPILGPSAWETQLGYDPFDWESYPYQLSDPPFDGSCLVLEPHTLDVAPELDPFEEIATLIDPDDNGPSAYRTLDMALRLFNRLINDPHGHFTELPMPDLFAAALHQALIWERG